MQIGLHHVSLPEFGVPEEQPTIPTAEYEDRARRLFAAADVDWVVVYGDREHYANLTWLSGFDPRFEESLLLLGPGDQRVLVVGNEDVGYAPVAGLPAEVILYQPFSLMAQPRGSSPKLADLLRMSASDPVCGSASSGGSTSTRRKRMSRNCRHSSRRLSSRRCIASPEQLPVISPRS